MATIRSESNGCKAILVVCPDKRRRTFRFGKIDATEAAIVKTRLQDLENAARTGTRCSPQTMRWVGSLPDEMRSRLVDAGLDPGVAGIEPAPWGGMKAQSALEQLLSGDDSAFAVYLSNGTTVICGFAVRSNAGFLSLGPSEMVSENHVKKWAFDGPTPSDMGLVYVVKSKMFDVNQNAVRAIACINL